MKKQLRIILLTSALFYFSYYTKAQTITTIAGNGTAGYLGDGGQATLSELNAPFGMCFDPAGNLYFGDAQNHRIRKISTSGIITTFAGTGVAGYNGNGGAATSAQFNRPTDIVMDAAGNFYVADELNFVIRKITPSGIVSTYAGTNVTGYSGDGGLATAAKLSRPNKVAIDQSGNIYISLYQDNVVRKVSTSGIITTVIGIGSAGFSGDGGLATSAAINQPGSVAFDNVGNIYFADEYNQRVRKVNASTGIITTVVGNGTAGYAGDGSLATSAELNYLEGICVDGVGNIYIGDKINNVIRKVNTSGIISTIAGTGTAGYSGDGGSALSALMHYPAEIIFDTGGNMYFSDGLNNVIRKITNVTVGINQISQNNADLNIYPNPNSGIVNVQINNNTENASYKVYNVIGKEVKAGNLTYLSNKVDLSEFDNGMYTIIVSSKEGVSSSKISLQK
jgi:trimeric autotransporter adhesin